MDIAVLVPVYNEEKAIKKVVEDFKRELPGARIYVYDNNSRDNTVKEAEKAGAIVRQETLQGKGHVVRRMFSDIDADIYVLVDGDDTYDATAAPRLVETLIDNSLDMVNGRRIEKNQDAYRAGHRMGNFMLTGLIKLFFGNRTDDLLSGYRVFSNRFVKSFPALSQGFEIETELTVHALELNMPMADCDTDYFDRAAGTESKLNTYRDGFRILKTITTLVKEEKPLFFFGMISLLLFIGSLIPIISVTVEFLQTHLVPRFPTLIAAGIVMVIAFLSLVCGLILDSVTHGRKEVRRLSYLSYSGTEKLRRQREA